MLYDTNLCLYVTYIGQGAHVYTV